MKGQDNVADLMFYKSCRHHTTLKSPRNMKSISQAKLLEF